MFDPLSNDPVQPFVLSTALSDFLSLCLRDNEILTTQARYMILCVAMPSGDMKWSDAERLRLVALERFDEFQGYLLSQEAIALDAVPGVGHRLVPPHEQVAWATRKKKARIVKTFEKAEARLRHVRESALNPQQRVERNNARARLATERQAFQKPPRGF